MPVVVVVVIVVVIILDAKFSEGKYNLPFNFVSPEPDTSLAHSK